MAKTKKTTKAPAKKQSASKSKATVTHEQQIENDFFIAANTVDNNRYKQAWERGESIPCAKDESK